VAEPADEMFGKVMSVSDDLMWRYELLLTDASAADIDARRAQVAAGLVHPKQVKIDLAKRLVSDFHSSADADRAAEAFAARFARGELSEEALPELSVTVADGSIGLSRLVVEAGLAVSASEATRKIQQGGVKVDREKVTDIKCRVPARETPVILEVGRRALRIRLVAGA